MSSTIPPVPAAITVEPWVDPVIDRVGHDPRSAYVETFWLGVLGPSTTWLVRRLVAGLEAAPAGYELDPLRTARALGIGHREGVASPFARTLARASRFGITRTDGDHLAVRRRLPPLSRRLLERLPQDIQDEHSHWADTEIRPTAADARERTRHLALNLLRLGEDLESAEAALHRRHVHPALASDAVRWAAEQLPRVGPHPLASA
jgi:hypothetical protein